jgi:hypothetical protein
MIRFRALALLSSALLACATPARANDSSAALATGGLTLTRNDVVEMDSEDLFISKQAIRVRYRFVNPTASATTTLVAFPMPDIDVSGPEENIAVPSEDAANFLDFRTLANGAPVTAQVEQKVFAKGVERTATLREWGVPLNPHLRETGEALDRLSPERKAQALAEGFADKEEYDAGKGWETHLGPRWTLKTTWFWEQTFAPGETVIEHAYKPSVGGSTGTTLGSPDWRKQEGMDDFLARYCVDDDLLATIERKRRAARADYAPLAEDRIAYVLKTGANWAKPIRAFRLVVDKGSPENLVSLCAPGVRKISPTQFEWRRENFTPTRDLDILILKKAGTD